MYGEGISARLESIGKKLFLNPSYTSIEPAISSDTMCSRKTLFKKFYITLARMLHPMYPQTLGLESSTSNCPLFPIRLVLKKLSSEIFTSDSGLSEIR